MAFERSLVGEAYVHIHASTAAMRREIARDLENAGAEAARDFDEDFRREAERLLHRRRQSLIQALVGGDKELDRLAKQFGSVDRAAGRFTRELHLMAAGGRLSATRLAESRIQVERWAESARALERANFDITLEKAAVAAHKINNAMDHKKVEDQDRAFRSYAHNIMVSLDRDATPSLLRFGRHLDRAKLRLDRIADASGRAFGRGSRNNFLNFFGSVVGNIAKAVTAFPVSILARISDTVGGAVKQFNLLKLGGASSLEALGATLGSVVKAGVPGLIALTVAIAGAALILPTLAAGISLLAGSLIAMVGAVSIGIAGGLLLMGPLLLSVAASVVVLSLAFDKFSKNNLGKKNQTALQKGWIEPLVKFNKETKNILQARLFPQLSAQFGIFTDTIRRVGRPLLLGMADAFGAIARAAGAALRDKSTQAFLAQFANVLPKITTGLGVGLVKLLQGLTAFFAPILPFALRLSTAFSGLMGQFEAWASSARGQSSVKDFMDTAAVAAEHLWSIIGNVAEIIGKLFMAGTEGAGQDFLAYLDDVTAKFSEWLSSPEGQTALHDFFVDVRAVMVQVKEVLADLITAFNELDTQQSRTDFGTFLEAVKSVSGAIVTVSGWLGWLNKALGSVVVAVGVVTSPLGGFLSLLQRFPKAFAYITLAVAGVVSGLGGFLSVTIGVMTGSYSAVASGVAGILRQFAVFLRGVATVLRGLSSIPGPAGAAFRAMGASVDAAAAKVDGLASRLAGIQSKTVTITARIVYEEQQKKLAGPGSRNIPIGSAAGRIVNGPMHTLIGEAGPEAVVPLRRPLSLVDPAVRALSAFAQGLPRMAGGGVGGGGRTINIHPGAIVVTSPNANPVHVAMSVLDRFAREAR